MILFGGDPHGDFEPAREAALRLRPRALILVGDLDLARPLHEEMADVTAAGVAVHWIHGNHDGQRLDWFTHCFHGPAAEWSLHARVIDIDGVRVAGLGGVFRGRIWRPPLPPRFRDRAEMIRAFGGWTAPWEDKPGVPLRHRVSIWSEDYAHLSTLGADILVTHEAPSCCTTPNKTPSGYSAIDDLAIAMGAKLVVHGHHHIDYQSFLPPGIKVIGIGLAGVRDVTGRIITAGKPEAEHAPAHV